MSLIDVLTSIELGDDTKYYKGILRRLKDLTQERGYTLSPPKSEWELDYLAKPRERIPFLVEGATSGVVGLVLVPGWDRKHWHEAWNRLEPGLQSKLDSLDESTYEGKKIRCALIQVWNKMEAPVLGWKHLRSIPKFFETGDFKVSNSSGDYVLLRRKDDGGNIKIGFRLEGIFEYLTPVGK